MLADFDNLNSSGGSRPGSIVPPQGAPPSRQPAAKREPQQVCHLKVECFIKWPVKDCVVCCTADNGLTYFITASPNF
jgi:hypothetical protein